MTDRCRFTADLWRWEEVRDSWFFVTLPKDASALVRERPRPPRGFGSVRVEATVGETTWRTSIFPDSRSGGYVLPVKKAVRTAEDLGDGDPVEVLLLLLE
jgi:hypothetical protein